LEKRCVPATFAVTTLLDNANGVNPNPGDHTGTLRQAIVDANASTDASSTIEISSTLQGASLLEGLLPTLGKNITIMADNNANPASVIVEPDPSLAAFRIFTIAQNTTCVFNHLGIEYGSAPAGFFGGGIANFGTLSLNYCTIAYNKGSGIWNSQGTLNLYLCSVYQNSNTNDYGGGILTEGGAVTIYGSRIDGNTAQFGGGIANQSGTSSLTIATDPLTGTASDVSSNSATADGGGIWSRGSLTMTGGYLGSNKAAGDGGGLFIADTGLNGATLVSVAIQSNQATGAKSNGGGFYLQEGNLTFNSITLSGNTAATGSGGAWNSQPHGSFSDNNPFYIGPNQTIVQLS
jgi:hypothetical protein